jgi:hypothetical protein
VTRTRAGAERRIGVELEFGGLGVGEAARIVCERLGGRIERRSAVEYLIQGDPRGAWEVAMDFAYLKEHERRVADGLPMGELEEVAYDLLRRGAQQLVPVEVVSPPLPMRDLGEVEGVVRALRRAGARGTTDGVISAFAMQLNPEMPDTGAPTILAYLRAFLCVYDWLFMRAQVVFSRRLTTYIDPFPRGYVRKVVDTRYRPDTAALIDDYLVDNPTRNRALDLLPLMLHVDEARVRAVTRDPRIKARPALHYRLPNCEIDRPGWGIHLAWNDWLQVEHLAAERDRLAALCDAYADFLERPLAGLLERWNEHLEPWLKRDHDL